MRSTFESLERLLGRRLRAGDRGSIDSLNDLPDDLIREVRALNRKSRVASTEYLQFYVNRSEEVGDFIRQVLESESISAADWGKRDLLCFPQISQSDLHHWSVSKTHKRLEPLQGRRWLRIAPVFEEWDMSGVGGAPGVLVYNVPYWYETPAGVNSYDLDSESLEEISGDVATAFRRWFASRIAWQCRATHSRLSIDRARLDRLEQGVSMPMSSDVAIAIEALRREEREFNSIADLIPGFRGPDEWYRS